LGEDSIRNGLLFVVSLQIDPGNIRYHGTAPIHEPDIGRLHEGINKHNFKNSLMIAAVDVIAPFRWKNFCLRHFFTSFGQDNYGGVCSLAVWMSSSIRKRLFRGAVSSPIATEKLFERPLAGMEAA
jgi:hypothetical protein